MTDKEKNTIEAMIAGDDGAFAAVYGAFYQKLYRTAYLMSGNRDDSEDILQETFVTVYLHRGELKNPMGIEKWIRKILVRKAVKLLKRKKQESSLEALLEDEETASKERLLEDLQGVSPQERAIQGEQQRQMMKLIAGLPVKLRTVVVLYYYEDCSIREIAEATGSLAGTVKSRLYQARKLIREGLE